MLAGVVLAVLIVGWLILAWNCPSAGIALTSDARRVHYLKNRTGVPQGADFDSRVTLDELLQPGDDRNRWSSERAARIEGEVIDVAYARPEATNCFNPCRRDIHILVAKRKGARKTEHVVLEVTPFLHESNWTEDNLQKLLIGHWCQFEGWLFFDEGHAAESENNAPGNANNWRGTAWEIHPVTKIRVIR
jgi:hypothetical protein